MNVERSVALVRVFSPDASKLEKNVADVRSTLQKIIETGMIFRTLVLVAADERYGDSDFGGTAEALRSTLDMRRCSVVEVKKGGIFCGVLNRGLVEATRLLASHVQIISTGVRDYITEENLSALGEAHHDGALATGLAIAELRDSISEGRLANTFSSWNLEALISVGGFDLRCEKPRKDNKFVRQVEGQDGSKYHLAGVEEIIPLLRMTRVYGRCIAPIVPCADADWQPPTDAEGLARHEKKLGTKFPRQQAFAEMEGGTFEEIRSGIIDGYPRVLAGVLA